LYRGTQRRCGSSLGRGLDEGEEGGGEDCEV
jgi:hypothetical protein